MNEGMKKRKKQMFREVWCNNLEEEFRILSEQAKTYHFVSMDTEFPGFIAKPIGEFPDQTSFLYQRLRCNVDLLKPIQVGITLTDVNGNFPSENDHEDKNYSTWQFNFKFDIFTDSCTADSLVLLKNAGINFENHRKKGISMFDFGALLISSGLVLNEKIHWITFHSGYDFGYLLKIVTFMPLPPTEKKFLILLRNFFPKFYDIKFMMKHCKNVHGGLQEVSESFGISRFGDKHQAGSDSLMTAFLFFKLRDTFFPEKKEEFFLGKLFSFKNE